MVWVKVDDQFPEHAKVIEAGRHLGRNGAGRVIAIWTVAMCFCNRNLTDGLVPRSVIGGWTVYDRRPLDVAAVMALPMPDTSPGLMVDAGELGYRMHDYAHYQPSRAQVKDKRAADAERKRIARAAAEQQRQALASAECPRGQIADSGRIPRYPIPCPDLSEKDHGAARRVRATEAPEVLKALIWLEVKAGLAEGETHWSDLLERVKVAASRAGIEYGSREALQFLSDEFSVAFGRMVVAGAVAAAN